MTIATITGKPTAFSLGGAHFFGQASRIFKIEADADPGNPQPIGLQIGGAGSRTAVDLSIDEAEALQVILAEAIGRRKSAQAAMAAAQNRQARAYFADPDGTIEA